MNLLRISAIFGILLSVSACSSLRPYSYSDQSRLDPYVGKLHDQDGVKETNVNDPISSICHLSTTRRNISTLWLSHTRYHGSAALIDGRYLLTAAHNLFNYPFSSLTSLSVTCGEKDINNSEADITLTKYELERAIHIPRYESRLFNKSKKYEYDYAFVDLGKVISDQRSFTLDHTDYFLSVEPGSLPLKVAIGGYPGGKISDGNAMYIGRGNSTNADLNLVHYNVRTATGNSGGPVWYESNGKYYIAAVHVANSTGRLVNLTLISDWDSWIAKTRNDESN